MPGQEEIECIFIFVIVTTLNARINSVYISLLCLLQDSALASYC